MYDRTVRRRRAVLALLVGLSLIILTLSFGESIGGPVRSVQRGMLEVLAPIQEGANRALKPVRDLAGWVGDTLDAKEQRDELRKERNTLREQVTALADLKRQNDELRRQNRIPPDARIADYRPVSARVIGRSPNLWYSTINVDKGTSAGVRRDQPVVADGGLIGKVTEVTSGAAVITLITDHTSGVSASGKNGDAGILQTAVGNPDDLLLEFLPRDARLKRGDTISTAGTRSSRLESLFPPNIPVGVVSKADPDEVGVYQRVHVRPLADLRRLEFVQILTRPDTGKVVVSGEGGGNGPGGGGGGGTQTAQVP